MLTVEIEKTPFYRIGEKRGEKRGEKKALLKSAALMIRRYKIPLDDIVRDLRLKKDEIIEYVGKL